EFMNRVDDLIVFRQLTKDDMNKIVELEVAKVTRRLKDRGFELQLTDAAKKLLVEKGWDEEYGARPLRRAVEKYVEDEMAEEILRGSIKPGLVTVNAADDKLVFLQEKPATTTPAS
ncbi:MAG: ATP-dependent Clp protease ATP-binding subunit, partial [Verrucomicrobiae bacterium]|nr:ATP-dependent Clp protease ATP-binding subunit [Verrucomicrobiae bacterium]